MAFRVKTTAKAKRDLDAILAWLLSQEAGETGLRWFQGLRDAKVEIPATRLESTDRSMLSFIRVHLCSSAARYAFLPAQREIQNPVLAADERR